MRTKFDNLKLSGKGIQVSGEYAENNIKLVFDNVQFLEIVDKTTENEFGWYANGEFLLQCDFTAHTRKGMVGESFEYDCKLAFIRESNKIISSLTDGELQEVDISEAGTAFQKMFNTNFDHLRGDINFDNRDDELIIISTVSEVLHVQSDEESINISNRGIHVLKLDDEKLSIINGKNGITVVNDNGKTVRIGGSKGIEIDGVDINFNTIAKNIQRSMRDAFKDFDF